MKRIDKRQHSDNRQTRLRNLGRANQAISEKEFLEGDSLRPSISWGAQYGVSRDTKIFQGFPWFTRTGDRLHSRQGLLLCDEQSDQCLIAARPIYSFQKPYITVRQTSLLSNYKVDLLFLNTADGCSMRSSGNHREIQQYIMMMNFDNEKFKALISQQN